MKRLGMSRKISAAMISLAMCGSIFPIQNVMAESSTEVSVTSDETEEKYELPENIRQDKESFDMIKGLVEKYTKEFEGSYISPTQYLDLVNGDKLLKRLNFYQPEKPTEAVNGEIIVDIPPEIAQVWRLFGNIRFAGSDASNAKIYIIAPDGSETYVSNYGGFWNEYQDGDGTNLSVSYGKISETGNQLIEPWKYDHNFEGFKIKITGLDKLNFLYIWQETGMPNEYDISAYGVMGKDKPIVEASIEVDTTNNLSINGTNKFEDEVFKAYHVNSGPIPVTAAGTAENNALDEAQFEIDKTYGFVPGRGAIHFSSLAEWGGLSHDPENSETLTKTDFDTYTPDDYTIDKGRMYYPGLADNWCLTLDGWPTWMWGEFKDSEMAANHGTPGLEYFDEASKLSAEYVKALYERMGSTAPKYIEVKNESTIPLEWEFFNSADYTLEESWEKLADFHNMMAQEIKELVPEAQVGGPSSAFMYLERRDFDEARKQLEFMDNTKDDLDYYSHHFYENNSLYINDTPENAPGFLAGRFEAVMDLLKSHMSNTDNEKPILITEEGCYNTLGTPTDYFQRLMASNGYMLRFMDYADSMEILVPYVYPLLNWKPDANNTFYKYTLNPAGGYNKEKFDKEQTTPMATYLDIWKDFEGAYLPATVEAEDALIEERVITKSVRKGDTIQLAVMNFNNNRMNLDLDMIIGEGNEIESITRKHLYVENGELQYKVDVPVEDMDNIYMRVQEMAMFEIKLAKDQAFGATYYRENHYAPEAQQVLVTGKDVAYTIDTRTADLVDSVLRFGYGKETKGLDGSIEVKVNGCALPSRSLEYTNKGGDVLTYIEFDIDDLSILKDGENNVVISMPEGGRIPSVQFMNTYKKAAPTAADVTRLSADLKVGIELAKTVYQAEEAKFVPSGAKWVNPRTYEAYIKALKSVEKVVEDSLPSAKEVEDAAMELKVANLIFNKYVYVGEDSGEAGSGNDLVKMPFGNISFEDSEANLGVTTMFGCAPTTSGEGVSGEGKIITGGTSEGVTDGNKAYQITVNELNKSWSFSNLAFTSNELGWDLSKGLTFDFTNTSDIELPLAISSASADTGNNVCFTWGKVAPGATVKLNVGASSADVDVTAITTVKIQLNEAGIKEALDKPITFVVDNFVGEETVAFSKVEPGADEEGNIIIDKPNTEAYCKPAL